MILHLIHDQKGTFLNYTMNSGLFSLHNYVISQFVWLLQSTTPLLSFSSEHLSSSFPPFHLCIIPLTSPFLQHPSFYLFSAISSPLLFQLSAYIVFVLAENSHFVSGGNCVFLCSARLSFFSCMFSMLAKVPLPACSRECAPSAAVP